LATLAGDHAADLTRSIARDRYLCATIRPITISVNIAHVDETESTVRNIRRATGLGSTSCHAIAKYIRHG
jgi:hypothetical protein